MQTKLPREKLTKKHIRKDIKNLFDGGIMAIGVFGLVILPLCILAFNIDCRLARGEAGNATLWFSVLMLAMAVVILVLLIWCTVRLFLLLYKEQYTIMTAPLVDKKEGVGTQYIKRIFARPYRLYFPPDKEYALGIRNYEWSEMYNLTEEGAYRYSDIGDEFYLVVDKSGKILVAYNKKLFELQE